MDLALSWFRTPLEVCHYCKDDPAIAFPNIFILLFEYNSLFLQTNLANNVYFVANQFTTLEVQMVRYILLFWFAEQYILEQKQLGT